MGESRQSRSLGWEIGTLTFHEEILSLEQQRLLNTVGSFMNRQQCYLAGGTAIALILGHRKSVDLDWFTIHGFKDPEIFARELKSDLAKSSTLLTDIDVGKGTVYATANTVRMSILEYPYPLLNDLMDYPAPGCRVASLDDLSCMKLSAVARRGSKKDFVDIYALLEKHASLRQMFTAYRNKYADHDIATTVLSLAYFDDADKEEMPEMLWDVSWEEIKARILSDVKKFRG